MSLTQSFVGEPFTGYLHLSNHGAAKIAGVALKVELSVGTSKHVLFDNSASPIGFIEPGDFFDTVVDHELRAAGIHRPLERSSARARERPGPSGPAAESSRPLSSRPVEQSNFFSCQRAHLDARVLSVCLSICLSVSVFLVGFAMARRSSGPSIGLPLAFLVRLGTWVPFWQKGCRINPTNVIT
ncbi:unnamed protein product [Prorocentrum cordatum]|uniref:Trafficking protein particle complex subunit 13 N-terminal domain-containing protein n=1 Tax=Prorocentrum cordatum TaxID=2364126 RepID=A0ABN9QK37_9DINO|nr:unnamed protein product [Polarella glacialis]